MKKSLFAIVVSIMLISLSFAAGAGEWKAVYAKTVFANSDTGEVREAIFVQDKNGVERQLTSDAEDNTLPSWSPDGTELVYDGNKGFISVMNADGTNKRALGIFGTWSSMSRTHVVYDAPRGNTPMIWAVPIDMSSPPLALAMGEEPDVSFDGAKVAFSGGGVEIININGAEQRHVTEGVDVRFLPDGRIVVLREMAQGELWVVDPDTGEEQFLTMGRGHSVSNDGWVIFAGDGKEGFGWYAILPDRTVKQFLSPIEGKGGYRVFGDLTPASPPDPVEEPRAVKPQGKLATEWARLKVGE